MLPVYVSCLTARVDIIKLENFLASIIVLVKHYIISIEGNNF